MSGNDAAGIDEVRAAISSALERLDEVILDVLHTAVAAGEARPAAERRLSRARNALRRALAALGDGESDEEEI